MRKLRHWISRSRSLARAAQGGEIVDGPRPRTLRPQLGKPGREHREASGGDDKGRVLSRHAAARRSPAGSLRRDLAAAGILVRGSIARGLAEEAPAAYKDVDEVVRACQQARLADPVARLVPVGVVKG